MGLDSSAFERGLDKANRSVKGFVSSAVKRFGAVAGAAGLGALSYNSITLAKELKFLAEISGAGVEEFQRMAHAAKTVGIEQDKLADIFKDFRDRVGDFLQTGGGPMADFFENIAPKVGVTADQFRELSGPQALQLYFDSLEKANVSQNDMVFFLEAMASDVTNLIPLLKEGGKAFRELGEGAKTLTKSEAETLAAAGDQINEMQNNLTILVGKILARVMPALQIFNNGLALVGEALAFVTLQQKAFFEFIGRNAMAAINPTIKAFKAFGQALFAVAEAATGNIDAAKAFFNESKKLAKESAEEIKNIPQAISDSFTELTKENKGYFKDLQNNFEKRAKNIVTNWDSMLKGLTKKSKDGAKDAGKAIVGAASSLATDQSATDTEETVDGRPEWFGKIGSRQREQMEGVDGRPGWFGSVGARKRESEKPEQKLEQPLQQMANSLKVIEREMTSE